MSTRATPPPSAAHRAPHGPSSDTELSRRFLAGAGFVIVAAALVFGLSGQVDVQDGRAADIRAVLAVASALCGLAVFALCRAIWRQIGDPAALWAGAAALAFAAGAATRPELVAAVLGPRPDGREWFDAVSAAGAALTPVLFAGGLVPWLLRRPLSDVAIAGAALGGVALVALLMRAERALQPALTVAQLTRAESGGAVAGGVLVAASWLALATGYTLRSLRRRWLHGWGGLMLFALTTSGLAVGAATEGTGWLVGGALLESSGALLALVGCYRDLTRAYEDQTLELSDSEIEAETAGARERVRAAVLRTQRHDLINAITAIDGAASILERDFDQLSARDRETLATVLGSGTTRLRHLLEQDGAVPSRVSFAETAATVAKNSAWKQYLEVDVEPDLLAAGSPGETAEVVRQLVEFAYRRAPGCPVSLRGERDGEWAVLRIEDRGPTVPRDMRRTMVDPDPRHPLGRDDTLEVRVAARLMRDQGGDLWVEDRPGGGSSFGICLPFVPARDGDTDGG